MEKETRYVKIDLSKTSSLYGLYIGPNDEGIDFFDWIKRKEKNLENKMNDNQ